jgi:hypothetical protein
MGGVDRGGRRCCDVCGSTAGTRTRTCPHRVDGVPYCKPPALCPDCLRRVGGSRVLHAGCAEPARQSRVAAAERRARLADGESFVASAIGGPDRRGGRDIPAGMVLVTFRGAGVETTRIIPAGDYDPKRKPALSDYPASLDQAAATAGR